MNTRAVVRRHDETNDETNDETSDETSDQTNDETSDETSDKTDNENNRAMRDVRMSKDKQRAVCNNLRKCKVDSCCRLGKRAIVLAFCADADLLVMLLLPCREFICHPSTYCHPSTTEYRHPSTTDLCTIDTIAFCTMEDPYAGKPENGKEYDVLLGLLD